MKKLMCPQCGKIFDYNEETNYKQIICPKCANGFDLQYGLDAIKKECDKLSKAAFRFYSANNYSKAIEVYEEALKYSNDPAGIVTSIIMANLYGMKIDKPRFYIIKKMLDEYDIDLTKENTFLILSMIKDVVINFRYYKNRIFENYTTDGVFNNKEGLEIWKKEINEINDIFVYFDEAFPLMDEEELKEFKKENIYFEKEYEDVKASYLKYAITEYQLDETLKVHETETSFIKISEKAHKLKKMFFITYGILLLSLIVFLVLNIIFKQSVFLYLMIGVAGLAIVGYFVFKNIANKF